MSADAGTVARRLRGTASAFLTCTNPSTSSMSSPTTRKRECPVRRVCSMTSSAEAVRGIETVRTRGVMTSAAVRSKKVSDRVAMSAVSASMVPTSAERRMRLASSWGVRAPDNSSCGSMPMPRRKPLAEPLRVAMSGLAMIEKIRTGPATTLPTSNGAEIPRNCGSNSPKTIENTVTSTSAAVVAVGSTQAAGSTAESGPVSSDPSDGWAR